MTMQDFETFASTRVASGEWTEDLVDRIVKAARIQTVADLYRGIERGDGPLGVHTP